MAIDKVISGLYIVLHHIWNTLVLELQLILTVAVLFAVGGMSGASVCIHWPDSRGLQAALTLNLVQFLTFSSTAIKRHDKHDS